MGRDHYVKIRDLGGTNGAFLASDKQNPDHKVVIKRLDGMEELSVSLRLRHDNIVRVLESYFEDDGVLYVVLEYQPGGDLDSFLSKLNTLKKHPTQETILLWYEQLLDAVAYCHRNNVIHRDIKPGNIFLSKDTKTLYLGDFGSAKLMQGSGNMTSTFVGSPLWISPEVLLGERYTFSSDMWSLGCVLYEIAAGRRPFTAASFAKLVQDVTAGKVAPLPATVPGPIQDIILSMLRVNPSARISADEALAKVKAMRESPRPEPAKDAITLHTPQVADLGTPQHSKTKLVVKNPPKETTPPRTTPSLTPPDSPTPPGGEDYSNVYAREADDYDPLRASSAPSSVSRGPSEDPYSRRAASSANDAGRGREEEAGPDLWEAHENDFEDIEQYLGQFRAHDYEVLKTQREREARASQQQEEENAFQAPPPNRKIKVVQQRNPSPGRPSPPRRPAPPQVRRTQAVYSRPSNKPAAKKRISVSSKPAVPKHITASHQPRQASHARSPPQYSAEEVSAMEAQREAQRVKREAERAAMKELIQQRRAKGKKDLGVKIVLPDQLEYTDNGIVPLNMESD